jgi:hypothetical protein
MLQDHFHIEHLWIRWRCGSGVCEDQKISCTSCNDIQIDQAFEANNFCQRTGWRDDISISSILMSIFTASSTCWGGVLQLWCYNTSSGTALYHEPIWFLFSIGCRSSFSISHKGVNDNMCLTYTGWSARVLDAWQLGVEWLQTCSQEFVRLHF